MNIMNQTSLAEQLNRTQQIVGKLTRLLRDEPGYLPAVLVANTGVDPRFPKEEFPNFVWFLESRDASKAPARQLHQVPTRMDSVELEKFRKGDSEKGRMGFIPTAKGMEMLAHLAHSYMHRGMPILEGGTSLGKTYAIRALTRLIHGNSSQPFHFYCDGQTDTAELLAKYVPNSDDRGAQRVSRFLQSDEGKKWSEQQYAEKKFDAKTSPERIIFDAANYLGVSLNKNSFTLTLGAVPTAAIASIDKHGNVSIDAANPGRGTILIVDEVGAAKSAIILALLRLRGDGEMVFSMQLWEDGGRTINFGPDCMVAFATNTLKYSDRNPVDGALARSLDWCRMGELDEGDIREMIDLITSNDYGQNRVNFSDTHYIDISKHGELYKLIGKAVVAAHLQVAPITDKSQAGGDRQKIPCTFEDILKTLKYCQTSQCIGVDDKGRTYVDMVATVVEAVERKYFGNIASKADRKMQLRSFINGMENDTGAYAVPSSTGRAISIFGALMQESIKASQPVLPEVPMADVEALQQLEVGRNLAREMQAVDDFMLKIAQVEVPKLIQFVKIVGKSSSAETQGYLKAKLESELRGPLELKTGNEWSEPGGLREFLLGLIDNPGV